MQMKNKEEVLEIEEPNHLQCQHKETDHLLAFHTKSISSGTFLVRSITDILIILLGLSGKSKGINIILDYGSDNHRRYGGVSNLAAVLEGKQPGITESLIGLHALTCCDFMSCFYKKGKVRPFQRLEADPNLVMTL